MNISVCRLRPTDASDVAKNTMACGTLTVDARLTRGASRRWVRACRELSQLNMNQAFEAIAIRHANRSGRLREGGILPEQLRPGRWASVPMLRKARTDVDRPTDFDANQVGTWCVYTKKNRYAPRSPLGAARTIQFEGIDVARPVRGQKRLDHGVS